MPKEPESIKITTPYITLGQLLKFADVVSAGGEEKAYLASHEVLVNGETENRRGRKLRDGDVVTLDDRVLKIVSK
jgi:S4 domain protein YaaA